MANRHRGYVEIELDGEDYILQFNYDAIARLEQRLGQTIIDVFQGGNIGFHVVREALAVGLSNPRNGRGAARALRGLDLGEFGYYVERIMDAFEAAGLFKAAADEGDEDDVGEMTAPKRGKGSNKADSTTTNSSD